MRESAPVIAILGIAAFLRLHRLESLPAPIHVDEAATAVYGLKVVNGELPLFGFGFTNHVNTAFILPGLVMEWLGTSAWNLRVLEVAFGLAAVLLTYLLGRSMFSVRVGLAAAAMLAFNHFAIAFSRLGVVNQQSMTLQLLAYWLLWEGFKRSSIRRSFIGGAFVGVVMSLYFASWIVPLLLCFFIAWALVARRDAALGFWRAASAAVAGFVMFLVPWLALVLMDFEALMQRPSEVFIFSDIKFWMEFWDTDSVRGVLNNQWNQVYETFTSGNDTSTHYGYDAPLLFPLARTFFVAGLFAVALGVRRPTHVFLALWLLPTVMLGGILTEYATFMPRLVGILPAVVLIVAVGIASMADIAARLVTFSGWTVARARWQSRQPSIAVALFLIVSISVVAVSGPMHARAYFFEYPSAPRVTWWPWIEPMSSIGGFISSNDDLDRVYIFSTEDVYIDHLIVQFYAQSSDARLRNAVCDQIPCPIPAAVEDGTTAYILPPGREHMERRIAFHVPGGRWHYESGPMGPDGLTDRQFMAYVVERHTPD